MSCRTLAILIALPGTLLARTELVHLRTENSCTFDNGDGTYTAEITAVPGIGDTVLPTTTGFAQHFVYHGNHIYSKMGPRMRYALEDLAWAQFILTCLPESISITAATFCYYQYEFVYGHLVELRHADIDPRTASAYDLYCAIRDGDCIDMPRTYEYCGWIQRELGAWGVHRLNLSLGRGWFTVGIRSRTTNAGEAYGTEGGSLQPQLAITFRTSDVQRHCPDRNAGAVQVTPNPTRGVAWLSGLQHLPRPALLEVADASGRSVLRRQVTAAGASQPLDLRLLPNGVYLVRLEAGDFAATQKLVIQR